MSFWDGNGVTGKGIKFAIGQRPPTLQRCFETRAYFIMIQGHLLLKKRL